MSDRARLAAGAAALLLVGLWPGMAAAAERPGAPDPSPSASAEGVENANENSRVAEKEPPSTSTSDGNDPSSHQTGGNASTQGDVDEPQPLSKADQNEGGANGQCPGGSYCSTRDGAPSGNGVGDGKALGKPCAGCVGKADNKNPQGQRPNGTDHNAGYECDRNQGIGKTNPAHTGCSVGAQPPPPPCVPTAANDFCGNPPPPGCVHNCGPTPPGPPEPPVCQPTPANDFCGNPPQDRPNPGPDREEPEILGEEAERPPSVNRTPPELEPAAGVLPSTGAPAEMDALGVAGTILVGAGTIVLLFNRRRAET